VFFSFWVIFLLFGLVSPVFFLTWLLTNSNVAGLFLIVAVAYFLLYEWRHLLYHLPEGSRLGAFALIRALKQHHQTLILNEPVTAGLIIGAALVILALIVIQQAKLRK
jgi:hypothetical protein